MLNANGLWPGLSPRSSHGFSLSVPVPSAVAPAAGIGMPGHFLVGDPADPEVFVDAFGAGAVLDRLGVEALFRRLHGDQPFDPAYLEPVGPVALLTRVLANLQRPNPVAAVGV